MGTVIGSVNQKGGQGKTQGIHAMSMVLAKTYKKKVLVVDFDPQGAQRFLFGVDDDILAQHPEANVALIFERRMDEISPLTISKRVDAILSDFSLSEYSERSIKNKENLLKKLVDKFRDQYDFILIDSHPTTGSLMSSVVIASDNLFIPIKTNYLDEKGTIGLFEELMAIMDSYDKEIGKITLIPNLYESVVNDHKESLSNIRNGFPRFLSQEYKGEIAVTKPIPKRALFGAAASNKEINNIVKFIEKKAPTNRDILVLLKEITREATGVKGNDDE